MKVSHLHSNTQRLTAHSTTAENWFWFSAVVDTRRGARAWRPPGGKLAVAVREPLRESRGDPAVGLCRLGVS